MTKFLAALATVLLLQAFWATQSEGARILVVFPPAAPSHFFLGDALVQALVKRGHDVTFISSFGSKTKAKNLKDVVLTGFVDIMEEFKKDALDVTGKAFFNQFRQFLQMTEWMSEGTLNHTNIQDLLKSNAKFDLVLMETFLTESHVGFAHHYDCPLVLVSTVGANMMVNKYVGNQNPPSYIPQMMAGFSDRMNFMERTQNFIMTYFIEIMVSMFHLPQQDVYLRKFFPTAPSLEDVIRDRVALVLLNSHPAISPAKPIVPNMIEIGGYHIAPTKPLPQNLQEYLDNAKEGFILFSMGSNLKSTMMSVETREAIMKVFAQLPHKVLWKFEDDQLPGKPANVRIDKWLPQNDILTHPNLKLFITHGGLLSTTEAVYHGVPIVGIPVIGDQKINMASAEKLGIGKAVDFKELTYEKLLAAVKEVLENKSYREEAKKRSALFRDQPMLPIDSAMYWIEFVLKHGYLDHLKTGAIYLSWYQIHSLDVLALLGSVGLAVVSVLYFAVKKCCCRKTKKYSQEKKKQ